MWRACHGSDEITAVTALIPFLAAQYGLPSSAETGQALRAALYVVVCDPGDRHRSGPVPLTELDVIGIVMVLDAIHGQKPF